ncbi:MAG: SpoIIE family protein phosphatase [Bacteroidetes bacterium]|nr:SpoIIE family protein phosphatase [Bacteroidota bacterium]
MTDKHNYLQNTLNESFFNKQPPIININTISYNYKGKQVNDSLKLHNYSNSISNLTFNYDAVSLTEGDYIQTKYNVLGFDTTWQTINTNEIKFSSLPPGSYTLQIKACNNHNFWSDPKQFAFSIDFPWYRTWFAYIMYLIIGGGSIYLFIKSRTRKLEIEKEKLEKIVEERTSEVIEEKKVITEQKHLIEEKHREITDSINYAERIQRSFLATKEQLDEKLKDYFVFFQPKDVVSGDFYWAHTLQNGNFALVTADSTGHGVPGAIMSLLNTSSLEKAVELGIYEPAEILNHTRQTIIQRLKKDGSIDGGKDGMDCSLISFNKEKTKLVFAAANNPIWIIRNNELIELSPDKIPVGKHDRDSISFTQHEVDI